MSAFGPYETEQDTDDTALCHDSRHLHDTGRVKTGDLDHLHRDMVLRHLIGECDAAGIKLGAYDRRILTWLANFEPATVQVVMGLIGRAHVGGYNSGWAAATAEDGG